jgi:hypothetical protein
MSGCIRQRIGVVAATLIIMGVGVLGTGACAPPSGAAGLLPPQNPPGNIAPSSSDWLTSIDGARAKEGVGPMEISESQFSTLPVSEQIFTALNLERIDRGLPPASAMTTQLDSYAQAGASAGTDPSFPSELTGGEPLLWGGAVWAGSVTSVLEADYYWMYSDGTGGLITNLACSLLNLSGCWGHRDIILRQFPSCPGGPATITMGVGNQGNSYAAEIVGSCSPPTDETTTWNSVVNTVTGGSEVVGMAPLANGQGYWEVEADGTVANFGQAPSLGSLGGSLNQPIVGMAATPDGDGYWLVAADGGIFSFGDARFYGSTGAIHLNRPVVGMASTPDGDGYWLVAADGGIFSFGDARFYGSTGAIHLNRPVVGMASDPTTGGYWLVASDGGIFSFNAPFFGSTGSIHLVQPIVNMEAAPGGQGYRFVAADGGVFDFGNAPFDGSLGGMTLSAPVVAMAPDEPTSGYWLAGGDGSIYSFGGANFLGRILATVGL